VKQSFKQLLKSYYYQLPKNLVALRPVSPRDGARLLVFDKQSSKINFDYFFNLGKYLPPNSLLIFNDTKVLPARLELFKPTGGKVNVLYLNTVVGLVEVMSDRRLLVGQKLRLTKRLYFEVVRQSGGSYFLKPPGQAKEFYRLLQRYGLTPLPPYLKTSGLKESDRRRLYQTVFAKDFGSIAAPTASLHFTKRLFNNLKKQGHQVCFVTLHVNLGTFASLKEGQVRKNKLHNEFWQVPAKTIKAVAVAKKRGDKVVAIGTTVVRTLESAFNQQADCLNKQGSTQLFISPGYRFHIVDCLITNFHVPSSSLMMLVAALIGRKRLLSIYQKAIKKKMRFFSFGDGMFIR